MLPDDLGLSRFLTRHLGSISTKWQGTAGRPRHTAQVMMTFWMLFSRFLRSTTPTIASKCRSGTVAHVRLAAEFDGLRLAAESGSVEREG